MRKTILLIIAIAACSPPICADAADPKFGATGTSFIQFKKYIQLHGWGLNNDVAAKIFFEERARIEKDPDAIILTLIQTDPEAHYWIASYLCSYGPANSHDLQLAELILLQGDVICGGMPDDQEARAQRVSINVVASIIAHRLGLSTVATSMKHRAQTMIRDEKVLATAFPGLSDTDREIYEKIKD